MAGFRKLQTSWFYDGNMSHQKDCYWFGVVSYSKYPSGDDVGPLVGVPEAILRYYDRVRVAGHATQQQLSTTAKSRRATSVDDSFRRDGNWRNRSIGSGRTAPIV